MPQYLRTICQPGGDPPPDVLEPVIRELETLNREMRDAGGGRSAPAGTRRRPPPCCGPPGATSCSPAARPSRARSTSAGSTSSRRRTSTPPWTGDAGRRRRSHPFDASRADLLRRLGRSVEAAAAYDGAIGSADRGVERTFLRGRRAFLGEDPDQVDLLAKAVL